MIITRYKEIGYNLDGYSAANCMQDSYADQTYICNLELHQKFSACITSLIMHPPTFPSSFSTERSKAVPVLQFFFLFGHL